MKTRKGQNDRMAECSIGIRRCLRKDLREVSALFRKTTAEPPRGTRWSERQAMNYLGQLLRMNPDGCYVAISGNQIAGGFFGHRYEWKDRPMCQIEEIFVGKGFRRKGIGRNLVKRAVKACHGKTGVWLYTDKGNPYLSFYKSLGLKLQTHVVIMGGSIK